MLNDAYNKAFDILGNCFIVLFAYTWARILLSIRIEKKGFYHTNKQKAVSYVLAFIGSVVAGSILGFMLGKSITNGVASFFVILPAALIATYRLYSEEEKQTN